MMTRQHREIMLDIPDRDAQIRAERDALWTAAKHVADLTNHGGTSLQVGHAIRVLSDLVNNTPADAGHSVDPDYAQGVLLGREMLAVLARAGYAVVKVDGTQ